MKTISTATFGLIVFIFFSVDPILAKPNKIIDLGLALTHRVDQLNWNIAASDGKPNVLSELTWRNLFIAQVEGNAKLRIDIPSSVFSPYMRGTLAYGSIYRGENQDSDYDGDNRTLEFSRSNNSGDEGNVLDASFGLGIQFSKKRAQTGQVFRISPLAGYSYHQQNLRMSDGFQSIGSNGVGPFSGLNSTYETQWRGPWLGVDFSFETKKRHIFKASFEQHWATYDADANWNLRSAFQHPKSFTHKATGSGILASLAWEFPFLRSWSITANINYQKWKTQPGTDTIFLSPSGIQDVLNDTDVLLSDGIVRQPLTRVNWESQAVSLGFQYRFQ